MLLQQVKRFKDLSLVYVVFNASKQFMDQLKYVKKGERTFDRFVKVQVNLAVLRHTAQELYQVFDRKSFLNIFLVNSAQTNKEMVDTLHELLSVVGKRGHHTVFDKVQSKLEFERVDWLGQGRCLDQFEGF